MNKILNNQRYLVALKRLVLQKCHVHNTRGKVSVTWLWVQSEARRVSQVLQLTPGSGTEKQPFSNEPNWLLIQLMATATWAISGTAFQSALGRGAMWVKIISCHFLHQLKWFYCINTMICIKIPNLADTEKEETEIMVWDTWSSWQGSMQWAFIGACVPWELWQIQALGLSSPQNWLHVSLGKKNRVMICAAVGELGKSGERATSGLLAWETANLKWIQYVRIGSGSICNSVLSQGGLLQLKAYFLSQASIWI